MEEIKIGSIYRSPAGNKLIVLALAHDRHYLCYNADKGGNDVYSDLALEEPWVEPIVYEGCLAIMLFSGDERITVGSYASKAEALDTNSIGKKLGYITFKVDSNGENLEVEVV